MYTSYIGKKFLQLYNKKREKTLSAREFCDEVLFPLFFNDERHLLHVHNSPFFQSVAKKDLIEGVTKTEIQRQKLHKKIASENANASISVGFAAQDTKSTTSGQITDIDFKVDAEESYASWIGQSLSIGVKGGLGILITNETILWGVFTGWQHYSRHFEQIPNLKGKQIETWNGLWICHYLSKYFDKQRPLDNFHPSIKCEKNASSFETIEWTKVVFAFSRQCPKQKILAYVYSLGQTNTTIGFIELMLPKVRAMYDVRDAVFLQKSSNISDDDIQNLEPFYSFKSACKQGIIGLSALEPKKLRDYMPLNSTTKIKDFKLTKNTEPTFEIYRIWIIAMLNKIELKNLATDIAQSLLDLESKKNRGKTILTNLSQEVRSAKNIRIFIEKLREILEEAPENAEAFAKTVEEVLKMPSDNFPLFITLIRFEYTLLKSLK